MAPPPLAFGLTPSGRGGGPRRGVGLGLVLGFGGPGPGTVLVTDRALSGGGRGRPGKPPPTLRALSGIIVFGLAPSGRGGGGPRGVG